MPMIYLIQLTDRFSVDMANWEYVYK